MKRLILSFLLFQVFTLILSEDLEVYYKDYIKQYGYELEENPVTTEDGFILSVWHLQPKKPNGKVVFLQHGLADTAWTFFQLKHKSLPFFLLQEGYDLWLGNIRGNIFSSKHATKKIKADYNNFTIDEFVKYDLPTMVDYVKSRTGVKKLSYIAHSQGSICSSCLLCTILHMYKIILIILPHWELFQILLILILLLLNY